MKVIICIAALCVVALAAPQGSDKDATVIKNDFENNGADGYNFAYETSNGISAEEVGEITNAGSENEAISVSGSFKYVGADGVTYSVSYVADEDGFQPVGDHIPE